MALCAGLYGWAGARRNIHTLTPLLIINILYQLPPCSIYVLDSPFLSYQLNRKLRTQVCNNSKTASMFHLVYQSNITITVLIGFPFLSSAKKSNLMSWCNRILSERVLNALTELGKVFHTLTICAEKKCVCRLQWKVSLTATCLTRQWWMPAVWMCSRNIFISPERTGWTH